MYNWSTDEKQLKKNKEQYAVWRLEQMINFGLGGEKLNEKELRKYWNTLHIDPARRRFLGLLLFDVLDNSLVSGLGLAVDKLD